MEEITENLSPMSDAEYRFAYKTVKTHIEMLQDYCSLSHTYSNNKLDESYLDDLRHIVDSEIIPMAAWKRIAAIPFHIAVDIRERWYSTALYKPDRLTQQEALKLFFDCDYDNNWVRNLDQVQHMPPFARKGVYDRFLFMFYYTINVRAELEYEIRQIISHTPCKS